MGVGIANPQRALEVAGDLVVSGTISGGAGMGSFRNRIINGDMRIAQRGTSATVTYSGFTSTMYFQLDRWGFYFGVGTFTISQQTLAASDTPYQLGFSNSMRITSSPGTGVLYFEPLQKTEGYMTQDFNWGTSFGVPVTLSFWFKSLCTPGSVVSVSIRNAASTYSYVTQFVVTSASTWQYYTFSIPPPPNGAAIGTGSNASLYIEIGGIDFRSSGLLTSTLNSWVGGNYISSTGATNILATAGNYIEFTGVQLEKGTVATPFEFRPYATELQLCQRYYEKSYDQGVNPGTATAVGVFSGVAGNPSGLQGPIFKVPKRADPIGAGVVYYSKAGTVNTLTNWSNDLDGSAITGGGDYSQYGIRYLLASVTTGSIYYYQWTVSTEL